MKPPVKERIWKTKTFEYDNLSHYPILDKEIIQHIAKYRKMFPKAEIRISFDQYCLWCEVKYLEDDSEYKERLVQEEIEYLKYLEQKKANQIKKQQRQAKEVEKERKLYLELKKKYG
jgi:hypothetical protein